MESNVLLTVKRANFEQVPEKSQNYLHKMKQQTVQQSGPIWNIYT